MPELRAPRFGAWALLGLWVACATVLLADANRFLPPGGEKFTDHMGPGGADLLPSFNCAHALLAGQNPYHYKLPHLPAALSWDGYTYQYPPTHFLIYVPLAWLAGTDFQSAARAQFYVALITTFFLAWAVVDLLHGLLPMAAEQRFGLIALVMFILTLNPGSQLGLERGQSDVITAALCWWAAAFFQRKRYGTAAFCAVASGLLKGYGVPFGAGLLLLCLRRDAWRPALLGSLLALAFLLAPVARFLPDAVGAFATRAQMFWSSWHNQSVYNLIYMWKPEQAQLGRKLFSAFAGFAMALAWLRLLVALRRDAADKATPLALYTLASLIFILSFSLNSFAYDAVLVLPGALYMILAQGNWRTAELRGFATFTGAGLALCMFGLCAMSLARLVGPMRHTRDYPAHAVGQIGVVLLIILISLVDWPSAIAATNVRASVSNVPARGSSRPSQKPKNVRRPRRV